MIAGKRYHGLTVDIWSCGVILFAMVCGYLPFEDPNTGHLYKKILSANYQIPSFVSPECKDLMRRILNTDPKTRYTIEDIREHPWYRQITQDEKEGIIVGINSIPVSKLQLLNFIGKL
jgi:5'-AMP-activated protein kinase catalytic alpha subunit